MNFLTAGESHGKGLLGIIEGVPAGLDITSQYINFHLSRRQKGFGRGARMKIEKDQVEIFSGIRYNLTLGSPIGLIIKNIDYKNWTDIMSVEKPSIKIDEITLPRPGHADLAGVMKYQFSDIRNVIERSSARETTMRVALGSICRKLLEELNIHVASYVTGIHNIQDHESYNIDVKSLNQKADGSHLRVLNSDIELKMINIIKDAQKNGDTVGGKFQVIISGAPYGLGSYTSWNRKINAKLAESISSINAIKSVSFGKDSTSSSFGSELHDEIEYSNNQYKRTNNNSGGIEGGMSNGQDILINAEMKPLSTLTKPLKSIDIKTKQTKLAHKERTDSCAVPAASIIAENMACITLLDAILEKFGGDSMKDLKTHFKSAKF
ncbi:MAG: chorismate synthase [Candidatus Marinimicrobia bacterium]|nr:chorismate synthase [Candidatus Neomarinimicrobiota bacterium]